ncbi:MAG: outer membrane beta-barrel protein [Ekhidna sp.]|uniref:outer membrane beta-barrel protein n=1 Tax=Ekhidna sp. TaxID=2608089 RepID=UPI0032EC22FA
MKKILLTATLVALFGFAATAQEQGEIRVGAGLVYGTKATVDLTDGDEKGALGINIGGEYLITDVISAAPSYTFFFKEEEGGASVKTSSFNLDARYYFSDGKFYALAGLGFGSAKFSGGGFSISDNETGINLGGGAMIPAGDALYINGQLKYNTAFEQFVIQAGLSYRIGG